MGSSCVGTTGGLGVGGLWDTGGLGDGLLSKKALTLHKGHPRLLDWPLSSLVGHSLEGMKASESWVERDLWCSRDGADRCRGASLHLLVVMHAIYWSAKDPRFPKFNSCWGWGSSGMSVVAITNVNSTSTRMESTRIGRCGGGRRKLKVCRCPVIGIRVGVWGAIPG